MSPYNDKRLAAIVGTRPGTDWIWCEECVRWENCGGVGEWRVHDRTPDPWTPGYRVWRALSRFFRALWSFCSERAYLAEARAHVAAGRIRSEGRLRS